MYIVEIVVNTLFELLNAMAQYSFDIDAVERDRTQRKFDLLFSKNYTDRPKIKSFKPVVCQAKADRFEELFQDLYLRGNVEGSLSSLSSPILSPRTGERTSTVYEDADDEKDSDNKIRTNIHKLKKGVLFKYILAENV